MLLEERRRYINVGVVIAIFREKKDVLMDLEIGSIGQ